MTNSTKDNKCKKKPVTDYCGGTCLVHYKCRSCGKIHHYKKAIEEYAKNKEYSLAQ